MNQSDAQLFSIQEIPMLYKRLFKKELDFYDMAELLPTIFTFIGIPAKPYLYKGTIANFELDLPCGVSSIKHVSDSKPVSWYSSFVMGKEPSILMNYRVDQSGNYGIYNINATNSETLGVETTGVYEVNKNIYSAPLGRMIDFSNDDNKTLRFNFKELAVDVLYVGIQVDTDGYPKVSQKALNAIAHYMNFIDVRWKYNLKQADINMATLAENDKNKAIAQARTPNSISQNEMDDLLNVLTSSNRKKHNFQFRK